MDLSSHGGEIPTPTTSTFIVGGHDHNYNTIHNTPLYRSNGPPPPPTTNAEEHHHHHNTPCSNKKGRAAAAARYRECLKNHAASIGGNALDGCGEFMPSGEEGTLEALRCSACSCHRNFHRKEIEGRESPFAFPYDECHCLHRLKGRRKLVSQKGLLMISAPSDAYGYDHNPHHHHMIMPLGALQNSESDEMEGVKGVGGVLSGGTQMAVKRRVRTKFTPEQKEKMLAFAERLGWRLQRQEEGAVQQFCQEIGVRRRVLKVWMHNNKHILAKKRSSSSLQLEE